jgi:hypothetical protein
MGLFVVNNAGVVDGALAVDDDGVPFIFRPYWVKA